MNTLRKRFLGKIIVGTVPDDCWRWTAAKTEHGYGVISRGGRKAGLEKAHRLSWMLFCGPIHDGLHVLHKCDNPECCNPRHLFVGTHLENIVDMQRKDRHVVPRYHGERNPAARIGENEVREIRRLCAARTNQRSVANLFGVTQALVSDIHLRKIWKHVDAS